jgi:hypothetical protein
MRRFHVKRGPLTFLFFVRQVKGNIMLATKLDQVLKNAQSKLVRPAPSAPARSPDFSTLTALSPRVVNGYSSSRCMPQPEVVLCPTFCCNMFSLSTLLRLPPASFISECVARVSPLCGLTKGVESSLTGSRLATRSVGTDMR